VTYTVTEAALADIMQLRVAVLRKGTPATDCNYPEDDYPDVVHFAIIHKGVAIATSSWFMKECPEKPGITAMQLKGMAVADELQGAGLGALLIDAGISLATERGATIAWARARDSALGFYERLGFVSTGDGFIDGPTAMPHHIVVRTL
jgi:GNAT superfamily N-acetyltransferase